MEIAKYYYPIYLFIVTIFTLSIYSKYSTRKVLVTSAGYSSSKSFASNVPCFLLALFMLLFIGLRPVSSRYFGDMANYVQGYYRFYEGVPFNFDLDVENVIWDNWWALWGSLSLGTELFFVLSAGIYFLGTYIFCKKVFPSDTFIAYLFFLAAFSTFSYTTNGCNKGISSAEESGVVKVYNMQGMLVRKAATVAEATKGLHGLYVVNGQKMLLQK